MFPSLRFPGCSWRAASGTPLKFYWRPGLKRSWWAAFTLIAAMVVLLGGCGGSGLPFNDTPAITNLFPSNITAGSDSFTLFVVGTGFIAGSKGYTFAYWNGSPLSTTMNVVTGQLEVQVPASYVATANVAQITVANPGPGGGESFAVSFTIVAQTNGEPAITLPLSPPSAKAGGAAFTLTVNGSNFAVSDTVTWNGSVRTTTFVNSTQVTVAIDASDITTVGSASVAVATPGLVVASPSVNFPITGPNNPMPSLSSLSPSSAAAGSPDLQIKVNGSGFTSASFVEWNGEPLAVAFVGGGQLIALVPAADLLASGSATVDVNNPAPGGGVSKTLTFTVK
jgi:hypothetical protein